MRLLLSMILAFSAALPVTIAKAEGPVVVELFTSQGCSACPPADALLRELSGRDDVIPLSLHVDYWDYIGWPDTFASPAFTARQYGYGHEAGNNVVYTPQFVVGGIDIVVGYQPMNVADLIMRHRAVGYPVTVTVANGSNGYRIEAVAEMDPPRPQMLVHLVTFSPHEEVDISRGENAGRMAEYHNVVMAWDIVEEWDGAEPFQAEIAAGDGYPMAVIVQAGAHGRILGAARLD